MPLGMEVCIGPGDFVVDGDAAPPPPIKKEAEPPPQFSVHVYCGQTAGWIKVALGTEMGLGPGNIVIDGDTAASPERGRARPLLFGPRLLWPNGCMGQDSRCHLVQRYASAYVTLC